MPKEQSTPSNRTRVSPYPLRSNRSNNQISHNSDIQTEDTTEWENVRCVICMEPPHNAILLNCSSSSNGCRPYICDTSARHSNCFKQFRKNNMNRLNNKVLKCPLCRGEVSDTKKMTSARKILNAKPRSCSVDDCEFSGTYSQLKQHMKVEHPGLFPGKLDPRVQQNWEQMERDIERSEILSAAGIPPIPPVQEEVLHYYPSQVIRVRINGIVGNIYVRSQVHTTVGPVNYAQPHMFRPTLTFHSLIP